MRKILKLGSDGGDSARKKCKRGCGGVWRSLESGGRFYVGAFGRNLASVAVKIFTFDVLVKKHYKCCDFNAICKDNVAINCITVQHKKKVHSR
jgi:hypothetical protein